MLVEGGGGVKSKALRGRRLLAAGSDRSYFGTSQFCSIIRM
jgi:hypothetical protein